MEVNNNETIEFERHDDTANPSPLGKGLAGAPNAAKTRAFAHVIARWGSRSAHLNIGRFSARGTCLHYSK